MKLMKKENPSIKYEFSGDYPPLCNDLTVKCLDLGVEIECSTF